MCKQIYLISKVFSDLLSPATWINLSTPTDWICTNLFRISETPFLMVMLFLVFLQIPLKDILKSFKNLKFTLTAVIINFIWTPLLILVLGRLFLVDHPELLIGYIMLMVTPCTDWYLIFTGISKVTHSPLIFEFGFI